MRKPSILIVTEEASSFVRLMQEMKRLQCPCNKICWCSGVKELVDSPFVLGKKWKAKKWNFELVKKADLILFLSDLATKEEFIQQVQAWAIPFLDISGKATELPLLIEDCQTSQLSRNWKKGFLPDAETIFCVYSLYKLKEAGLIQSLKIKLISNQRQTDGWISQKKLRVARQLATLFNLSVMTCLVDWIYQPQAACSSEQVQVTLLQSISRERLVETIQKGDHVLLLQQENDKNKPEILSQKETRVLVHVPLLPRQGTVWPMQFISDSQLCGNMSAGVLLILDLLKKGRI